MALAQFFLLALPDSVAEDAARVVVYATGTNNPATIFADRARVFPYSSGIISVQPGQSYVSFYGDEVVDVEIQDSSYATLQIFRGVAVQNSEPAYDGDNDDFNLAGLEQRVFQGGFAANPSPISTVVAGVLNVIGEYELHTVSAEGEEIHTVLAASTSGRLLTLYFTGTCRLYTSSTGNLSLERDYVTTAGSLLTLQAVDGRFREVSRADSNPDQGSPVVITINDEFILPYNTNAFHVVSNSSPGNDLKNIYLHDSTWDIPNGTTVTLRTYVGQVIYRNSQGNLRLQGDFTAPQGCVLTLIALENLWHEIARSWTGNNIQQQVSIPEAASQSVTLTNTTRAVLLKSSGDANNPAPPVWFMRGGQAGDEITLMVSPTGIEELPPTTYLSQRVPVQNEAIAADGYFKLTTGFFGMVPGDCLKVIRLTDEDGYYYWQEVSRSMIDIEPAIRLTAPGQGENAPYSLAAWRLRHAVSNETGFDKGDNVLRINYIEPNWLPAGCILALRASGSKFKITEKGLDGVSESPNVIVADSRTITIDKDAEKKANAYFLKAGDPTDTTPNVGPDPDDDSAGTPANVTTTRNWIQIKHGRQG